MPSHHSIVTHGATTFDVVYVQKRKACLSAHFTLTAVMIEDLDLEVVMVTMLDRV
jgi:hypothetical protein